MSFSLEKGSDKRLLETTKYISLINICNSIMRWMVVRRSFCWLIPPVLTFHWYWHYNDNDTEIHLYQHQPGQWIGIKLWVEGWYDCCWLLYGIPPELLPPTTLILLLEQSSSEKLDKQPNTSTTHHQLGKITEWSTLIGRDKSRQVKCLFCLSVCCYGVILM